VHERQEEEAAQLIRHVLIVAALERAVGDLACERVGRIGARIAAKHVARELIEHDAERERAIRGRLPRGELARSRGLVGRHEAVADGGVERVVLAEPLVVSSLAPEGEDGFGSYDRRCVGCIGHRGKHRPEWSM